MKITIFGATGMVGGQVVKKALATGHSVVAFGRNVSDLIDKDLASDSLTAFKGYIFDDTDVFNAIKDSDGIISVLGGAPDGEDKTRSLGIKNIVTQMGKAHIKRIVALGGLGVLNADENTLIIDTPNYPKKFVAVGREHLAAYQYLQASNLEWTFICPADIKEEAPAGNYITRINYPPEPNSWKITAEDLAAFLVKTVENNEFLHQKVGICS